MAQRVETDIAVRRFGYVGDADGKRLLFPRAETGPIEGSAGALRYGARDCALDGLEGRLDTLRWTADAASLGEAWLRDQAGRVDLTCGRIELPRGLRLVRADRGVEIVAPYVSLSDLRLAARGPFGRSADAARAPAAAAPAPATPASGSPAAPRPLRQERLRFLDSLAGRIGVTIKVVLDLPVLGRRSLDQALAVPIRDGQLDYRALDDSLDWLEGAFLDLAHDRDRLALSWKVPIIGSPHELIAWRLEQDAAALAAFGRVPVRALTDFELGGGRAPRSDDKKRGVLQALSLDALEVALSLLAPRMLEAAGGLILFGGDDQPGMVDLKVAGSIHDHGPGALTGAIGSVDTTIKDVQLGPVKLTADRLHVDGVEQLEVAFDGFRPATATLAIHRVTATNLALQIGGS